MEWALLNMFRRGIQMSRCPVRGIYEIFLDTAIPGLVNVNSLLYGHRNSWFTQLDSMVDLSSSLCKRWPGRVPFLSINCQINPLLRWMISYFTFCYLPLLPGFKKIIKWQTFRQIATKIARQFADRIRVAFLVVTISYGALEMVVACRVDWHFFLVCSGHHSFRCPVDVEPSYPTKRVHFFCLVSMKHIPELKENWPKPWMKPGFDERIFHQIYGMAVVPNSHGSSSCCFWGHFFVACKAKAKCQRLGLLRLGLGGMNTPILEDHP